MKNPKTLKHSLTREQTKLERRAKRLYALAACFLLAVTALAVPALAADDPWPSCKNCLISFSPSSAPWA